MGGWSRAVSAHRTKLAKDREREAAEAARKKKEEEDAAAAAAQQAAAARKKAEEARAVLRAAVISRIARRTVTSQRRAVEQETAAQAEAAPHGSSHARGREKGGSSLQRGACSREIASSQGWRRGLSSYYVHRGGFSFEGSPRSCEGLEYGSSRDACHGC